MFSKKNYNHGLIMYIIKFVFFIQKEKKDVHTNSKKTHNKQLLNINTNNDNNR